MTTSDRVALFFVIAMLSACITYWWIGNAQPSKNLWLGLNAKCEKAGGFLLDGANSGKIACLRHDTLIPDENWFK